MNRIWLKYIIYFIVLALLQVLVLNNMQLSSYLNPYGYVLLIIILPFETPGWLLLSVAFAMGLTIDLFPQGWSGAGASLGFHTAATVLIAFLRPVILKWINPRDEYEAGTLPDASDYGFGWYLIYTLIMVTIHHFVLFSLEAMSVRRLPDVLLRTFLSVLFTLFLIMVWEGMRYKRR